MALTMPATSAGVSPRALRSVRREPTWTSSAPCKISENAASVSSLVRERSPLMRVSIYGLREADMYVDDVEVRVHVDKLKLDIVDADLLVALVLVPRVKARTGC